MYFVLTIALQSTAHLKVHEVYEINYDSVISVSRAFSATYDSLGEKSLFNSVCINFTSCIIILRNESLKGQEHPLQNETNAGNLIVQMKLNLKAKVGFQNKRTARDFPRKVTFNY